MVKSQDYSKKLLQIRSKQGLSQEELASRLNVSFATVNRWENCKSEPQKAAKETIDEMFEGLEEASRVLAPATRRKRGVPVSGASAATTKPMEQMLWDAACSIRGEKDAAKFKDYLLPLLFLKRLSDVFDDEIDRLAEEYDDRETALEIVEDDHGLLRFYLPPEARWAAISGRENYDWPAKEKPRDIGEHLTKAVRAVVKHNPQLSGVIDVVDFAAERNGERDINPAKLRNVVETFSDPRYRLGLANVQPDFLGRAYEYLLRKFAEGSGQSAGEFFTPTEVGYLMAHIIRPKPGEECHDYACGSAGLLVKLQLVARELDPTSKVPLKLAGQEIQAESFAVAKMNGIIHDMNIDLQRGDTMINPKFRSSDGRLKTFDIVVANPMWNQAFSPDVFANDPFERFRTAGGITSGKGDWAWLQHTYACLNGRGRAAVVLDAPAMSRGSGAKNEDRERSIRKWFVDNDLIEGVLLLPENLFYNTPAAGIIIVLNKNKPYGRKNKIVLVNASSYFKKGKPKNYIPEDAIHSISSKFIKGETIQGEVAVVELSKLKEADYNLSPTRWIKSTLNQAQVSLGPVLLNLQETTELDQSLTSVMIDEFKSIKVATEYVDSSQEVVLLHGWLAGNLSEFIERPEYGHTASASDEKVGPKFLRITDIQDGAVNWDSVPYCFCDEDSIMKKQLEVGDILIARIGATTGKSLFIADAPLSVFASYLIRIRAKADRLLPKYLYYYLQTDSYWAHIDRHKGDRLKGGVNIPVLESLRIIVPPINEQIKIVQLLDQVEAKIALLKKTREVVDSLSKCLLHGLDKGTLNILPEGMTKGYST